ncbi:MAG: hypothetical protein KBC63_04645 [Candidatus Levybacteria bacterium]|nr:hypothetical protein [Candidatus Levybacteria bacterium]
MKQLIVIVLVLAGLYFMFDHTDPLPLNHEAIGLGVNHMAHSLFGIILLVVAGFVWWKSRKEKKQV